MTQPHFRRLSYALGAEVTGVDLGGPLDDNLMSLLRSAWLEHLVLYFPSQQLTSQQVLAFAARFGGRVPPCEPANPELAPPPESPGGWDGYKDGHNWHSDKSFTKNPTIATLLYCRTTPKFGGDTVFANMYMAHDALSLKLQSILTNLSALHVRELSLRPTYQRIGDADRVRDQILDWEARHGATGESSVHPVVRTHPETGRKALFLGARVRGFVGMTEAESHPLLEFLNRQATIPELTYRHRWSVDDIILWDNRCLQHIALCDYDVENENRHMLRCVINGPGFSA